MEIVGGIIGGVGSLVGGSQQAKGQRYAADKAAETARLGFDYLKGSPLGTQYLPSGGAANAAQANLLGVGGDPTQSKAAFENYLQSTGHQFQMDQGTKAITGGAASRGLLNSGATLKALTKFGQDYGKSSFSNYLNQLGGLSSQGLQAGSVIGGAGSSAGDTGANAISQGYGAAAGTTGAAIVQPFGTAAKYFANYNKKAV